MNYMIRELESFSVIGQEEKINYFITVQYLEK